MRKVFIDCGAWEGLGVKFFMDNVKDWRDYEIYAFECNERVLKPLVKKKLII